jgi:hypothetical protein
MAANDERNAQALRFDLPDGDVVYLCTWEFVKSKIDEIVVPMTSTLTLINQSLESINNTLVGWIPDEEDES